MPNLIPLPSNAFSGAAVKWDNAPVDRALLQNTWAKQQASQLALDKYFDKQAKELSPTGMDLNTDREGFMNRKQAWSDYALQNRKAIVNPSLDQGAAAAKAQMLYNDVLTFAQRSKQKVKNAQTAYGMLKNPSLNGMITDDMRDMIHKGTLGLDDPEHVDLDMNEVTRKLNPKPWGTSDENGLSTEVNRIGVTPQQPTVAQDAKTGMQTTTTENKFAPDALDGIYKAGATRYHENLAFKKIVDDIPKYNPNQFNDLKTLFKKHYGRDLQTDYDLAAAYALSSHKGARPDIKSTPIPGYSDIAQNKKLQVAGAQSGITLAREKNLADYNRDQKQKETEAAMPDSEGLLQNIENKAKTKKVIPYTVNGQQKQGYIVEPNPKIAAQLAIEEKGHKVEPDQIVIDPKSGDYTGIWFQKDENGKPKASGENAAISKSLPPKTLSRESIKNGLNQAYLPKKAAGAALPKPTPAPVNVSAEDVKKKYNIHY